MKYKKRNTGFFGLLTGLLAGFIFIMPNVLEAQTIEVGASAGVSYYIGDINPAIPYSQSKLAYGALVRYNFNKRWAVRFAFARGKLVGDDLKTNAIENRDLNFKSNINDFSLVGEFNFWDYFTGSRKNYFTPYIFGGIGFFTFKPFSFDGVNLQAHGTEGQSQYPEQQYEGRAPYKLWSLSVPFGIGFKYSLTKRLGFSLEWGMRKTFTDYIDDISTTYYTSGDVVSDPTLSHSAGMQR